jgi:hypothetical protein
MKYRKKPVVIDAERFYPLDWVYGHKVRGVDRMEMDGHQPYGVVKTLEGEMRAEHGDWIIRGVAGEFYPCKPDIFEATYELVEGQDV